MARKSETELKKETLQNARDFMQGFAPSQPDTASEQSSAELQRLASILTEHGFESPAVPDVTEDTPKASAPPPPEITYDRVPYLNDDITFKDRESELTLLIQLLNFRRESAIRELNYVQRCRDNRYYPGVIHQDPEIG